MAETRGREELQQLELQMQDHAKILQRLTTRIDDQEKSLTDIRDVLNSLAAQQNLLLQRLEKSAPTASTDRDALPSPRHNCPIRFDKIDTLPFKTGPHPSGTLSSQEIDAKRSRGECLWCNEKFVPGHTCSKKLVLSIDAAKLDTDEEFEEIIESPQEDESPVEVSEAQVSIHALPREHFFPPMKIIGSMVDIAAIELVVANGTKLPSPAMLENWVPVAVLVIPWVVGCCLVFVGRYQDPFITIERDYDGFNGPGLVVYDTVLAEGSFDPKGCFNIGLPSGKSLFQIQAEKILCVQKLARRYGGVYSALKASKLLEDMASRGIKYLDCYGVDNALVRVADPTFFFGYFN